MSSDNTQNLQRLLQTFDAQRLGEGDVSAGANVIAAMACAIANVHRHGTAIVTGDGASFRVGTSVLAYGPLTSALIGERVTSMQAEFQANLNSHCNEWELAKDTYRSSLDGKQTDARFTVRPSIQSLEVLSESMHGNARDNLAVLLSPLPNRTKRALLERPLIHATGTSPAILEAALERSHAGQLLVHDVLRDPSHCADMTHCYLPLIDGCLAVGKQARAVRGHLQLCDPAQVLDEVLRDTGPAQRLMMRLPWLVDGNAGPSLPAPDSNAAGHARLDQMETRFRTALAHAWLARLDYTTGGPEQLAFDFTAYQARWVAFLQQKEAGFPGISATARPLLGTLLFGLHQMVQSLPKPEGVKFYVDEVEALARILIQRMINVRAVILHDASKQKRERQLQLMLEKLSAKPSDLRQIVRKHHNLPTAEARDLLCELVSRGQALHLGKDRYQLAPIAVRTLEAQALTLDI
jgi:hypothetical protein